MKQLFTLMKYASSLTAIGGMGAVGRKRQGGFKYMGLVSAIIILLALGIPLFFLARELMSSLRIPLSAIGLPYPGYLADIFLGLGLLAGALLLFLSYSPSVAFNLFGSEDLPLLLTLPITRATLFLYKAIDSLSFGAVGIAVILPIILAYAVSLNLSVGLALVASLFFLLFFGSLSMLVAALLSRLMSGSSLKRFAFLLYLCSIIGYVLILQVLLPQNPVDTQALFSGLQQFLHILYSPFLFTRWVLDIFQGGALGWIAFPATIAALGYLTLRISNRLAFQSGTGRINRKVRFASHSSRKPLFQRDLRLLMREPMNLYGFIYPVALSLILFFLGRKGASLAALPFTAFLAVFFSALATASLLREERKAWPTPLLLPLQAKEILRPKLWLPSLFLLGAYLIVLVVTIAGFQGSVWLLLTVPMALGISLCNSQVGAYFYLKRPVVTSKNVFGFLPVMVLEISSLLLVAFTIVLFSLYLLLLSSPPIKMSGFLGWLTQGAISLFWGLFLPCILTLLLFFLFHRGQRILTRLLREWDF